jgi:CubicO group peptidase (beta-lactamase class C family)
MQRRDALAGLAGLVAQAALPVAATAQAAEHPAASSASSVAAPEPLWPGAAWAVRPPAPSGWRADRLPAIDAAARAIGSDALLLVHRGAVVHALGDTARPMNLYSGRKSVLSMLVGIEVARGRIDLQATLGSLGIDDHQALSERERSATVQQLLQARSGVYHPAAYETTAMALERPARGSHAPGSHWVYNNWDFNTLATIFGQCSGRNVFEALDAELAQPLQFQDFRPDIHTRWHHERASRHPAYLMFLSARDCARLGLLMARGGRWGDVQRLPQAWVDESTVAHSVAPGGWWSYGYLWWQPQAAWPFWTRRPGDVFLASGNYGQVLLVDRARDLVVVHRIDGSRWFKNNPDLGALAPLFRAVFAALPPEGAA